MTDATAGRGVRARVMVTPEGLPLSFELAPIGARIAAFGLDLLLVGGITAALLSIAAATHLPPALWSALLLASFVLWNGYFVYFELRWRGTTPGKRAVGLQVVARDGGPLGAGAVVARNLMRELELYLPLQLLAAPQLLFPGAPGWAALLCCAWAFLFLLLPAFNRDRARCGDLVAGTLVVLRPRAQLLPDAAALSRDGPGREAFEFSDAQLDLYGIRELQVLEDLVRDHATQGRPFEVLRAVCDRIGLKIGWEAPVPDAQVPAFLRAFYLAQRRRLEQRLLWGERRERKKSGRLKRRA